MALTSNKNTEYRNIDASQFDELPVLASSSIYQSAIVAADSSGYIAQASDSASVTGVGYAVGSADNSTGSSGAVTCKVITGGEVALQITGTVGWGDPVYANSDEKVARSGSLAANGVFVGHAMEAHETRSGYTWIRLTGPNKTGYTFPV